jgi:hypothetical protein
MSDQPLNVVRPDAFDFTNGNARPGHTLLGAKGRAVQAS